MRRMVGYFGGTAETFVVAPPEETDPITVIHAWVGNVSDSTMTVKMRSIDALAVTMHVSTASDLSSPMVFSGSEGNDDVWTINVTGLSAETTYYYGFPGDVAWPICHFQTWPVAGDVYSFLIGVAGDQGSSPSYPGPANTSNTPAWDRIRDHTPLFMMFIGDLHYDNNNTTSPAVVRQSYKDVIANARFKQFIREVPTQYVWDDHDYGPNDANGTYVGKANSQACFREYVPHWPLAEGAAIYHSFVVGRVRFIHIDSRSGRTPKGNIDNSSKTRLGTTQKAWLKAELLAATEPLIVLNVMSWFGETTSFGDGWDSYNTERVELAEFFEDNSLTERIFMIGADIHELQYDDGTNTQFDSAAVTPGPPFAGFAPMDCSFNHFAATCQETFQTRKQQYGTMLFTDTGSQITVRARGYALSASPGATSSVQFDHSVVYPG